jgi:hypothetical protein
MSKFTVFANLIYDRKQILVKSKTGKIDLKRQTRTIFLIKLPAEQFDETIQT